MAAVLDFEKPIIDIQNKIDESFWATNATEPAEIDLRVLFFYR